MDQRNFLRKLNTFEYSKNCQFQISQRTCVGLSTLEKLGHAFAQLVVVLVVIIMSFDGLPAFSVALGYKINLF